MLRGSVLLVALFTAAPTIWAALKDQTLPVQTAMLHFLVAVPIVAVLLGLVRSAMAARAKVRSGAQRRHRVDIAENVPADGGPRS